MKLLEPSHRLRPRSRLACIQMMAWTAVLSLGFRAEAANLDSRGGQFIGFNHFGAFKHTRGTHPGEEVLTSPIIKTQLDWDQLVASWNAEMPKGTFLRVEVRACYLEHPTRYYTMGRWSSDPARFPRESVAGQQDADGEVSTDTLLLKQSAPELQVRLTLGGDDLLKPTLKFLGLALLDTKAKCAALLPNRAAWNRALPVPERSQMNYADGKVLCSPTTVSMLLTFWAKTLNRPELDHDVPEIVRAIYDSAWKGTGNWPFNMAYAGSFPGMRAYVARLSDISEIEDWIAAGVPVGLSVDYDRLRGKGPGPNGHLVACVGFTANGDPIINDPGTSQHVRKIFARSRLAYAWASSHNTAYLVYPETWEVPRDRFGHWDSWTAHLRVRWER